MNPHKFLLTLATLSLLTLSTSVYAFAPGSDADKAFTAKVSQGGLYEVTASKYAAVKASAPDVKDVALTEVHDHELVNAGLKKVAAGAGVAIAPGLNAEFT